VFHSILLHNLINSEKTKGMPCLRITNSKLRCRNCPFVGEDAVATLELFNVRSNV